MADAGMSCPRIKELQWTTAIIDLVELIYDLHEAVCFATISLKDLLAVIGDVFGCEVKNHYRLFWDIKNRTIVAEVNRPVPRLFRFGFWKFAGKDVPLRENLSQDELARKSG